MRISCATDHLADRLATAARATSTRASIQVASGVRITAVDAESPIELAATDLELSLRVPADADVEEPGTTVVPARLAQEVLRALRTERVTLESSVSDGRVQLTTAGGLYALHTHPVEDFPRLPDIDHERLFTLDREVVSSTIERVLRAASKDESRPVLTGVLVHIEPGTLTMAATDSYRLAAKETTLTDAVPEPLEAIIPGRALAELIRLCGSSTGPLSVLVDRNHVAFGVDSIWLTARRIEGQFPNFRSLRPTTFEHEVTLPKDEFADLIRRVGVFARHNAPLRLSFADGAVTLAAQTPDVGEARESLPAPFNADPFEIGFNAEFLRDGVDGVSGDELVIRMLNPLRPALISGTDDEYWYLIMPIRLT